MSLQEALNSARLEQMLKEQEKILRNSEPKKEPSDVVKHLQEKTLDEVIQFGGISYVNVMIGDKQKKFKISVHPKGTKEKLPEFKFHVKSALGHTVYIQAKDRMSAQLVVNELFGKGRYVVSAAYI